MAGKADDYLITLPELADVIRAGHKAYKEGRLEVPEHPTISSDPHGIVAVFAERLEAGLARSHPETATRDAMLAVDSYLRSSKFVDLGSKSVEGPMYTRVDRPPEEMRGPAR